MKYQKPKSLGIEDKVLAQVCQALTETEDWKSALDRVASLIRPSFIFDNLVVYLTNRDTLAVEVMFARAMGRGRSSEADIAWGEQVAGKIAVSGKNVLQTPESDESPDRLQKPYIFGAPLAVGQHSLGSIIFIRFGKPTFSPENVALGKMLARLLSILIEKDFLEEQSQLLEEQHRQTRLQENFISTITHELRSPLGFIKGYTTTLLRSDTAWDSKTQQEFLEIIDQETDHLQELIENLLDSARLQSGQMEMHFQPVRLDGLLNDMIARAKLHHPKLQIELESPKSLQPVRGDPYRLAQVFENLISNAVKYAPASPVMVRIRMEGANTHISFADKGPGIASKYLERVFQRFFRGPNLSTNVHGSGLGLYICQQIVQAHAGRIYAESGKEPGTIFHIQLPVGL